MIWIIIVGIVIALFAIGNVGLFGLIVLMASGGIGFGAGSILGNGWAIFGALFGALLGLFYIKQNRTTSSSSKEN